MPYFPICTRLFDERPLNIKSAVSLADKLKEKPLENKNENKSEVCVNLKILHSLIIKIKGISYHSLISRHIKLKLTV